MERNLAQISWENNKEKKYFFQEFSKQLFSLLLKTKLKL